MLSKISNFYYDREKTISKLIENQMQVCYGLLLFSMFVLSVATGRSLSSQELPKFPRSYEAAYSLPLPLSKDDSLRYMRIFELQKKAIGKDLRIL